MERYKLEIWTDGSCYWKTRQGGSGAYIKFKDKEYFLREDWGYSNTTIERREIYAILMALRAIKKNVRCNATFYIDRENVVNFIKIIFLIGRLVNFRIVRIWICGKNFPRN